MSGKNQFPVVYNWSLTNPIPTFLPQPANQSSSPPSGLIAGPMSSTNTIYSQIVDLSRMDSVGLEVTWTGTPMGTFQVYGSNSGIYFYPLTFNPALAQPSGSAGGYLIDLQLYPFKFIMLQYANSSGSGSLYVYGENKDLN